MSAIDDIRTERERQIRKEGWTLAHDDTHADGQMAGAAICYILSARGWLTEADLNRLWCWWLEWWKPKDARRDLVRAGALIVAEIERLDRAAK